MDIEEEIDKMYEELDQKQAKMEELGLINYGDSGYYWRNPEEYEKDKKICELESEIERLEHKLAEKETDLSLARNEINTLKHNLKIVQEHDNVMCEQYFNKCKEHQDKIDYAVEQLERAKELVEKRNNGTRQGSHSVEYKDGYSGCSCDVDTIIDQLITEIKEGK